MKRWVLTVALLLASALAPTALAESPSDRQDRNLPEYTLVQEPEPSPTPSPVVGLTMRATHYGESYNGGPLGCGSRVWGYYSSGDPTIAAVSPSAYGRWPCGTRLRVSGPVGSIEVIRKDACPGCDKHGWPEMIDLSEAGHAAVCGIGTCVVTVEVVE